MHVGRAEVWSAARAPTDTWQSTAGALRKQPPRDAQQAGVRRRRPRAPLSRVASPSVPIPHQNPQAYAAAAATHCTLPSPRRAPPPCEVSNRHASLRMPFVGFAFGTAENPSPGRSMMKQQRPCGTPRRVSVSFPCSAVWW